MEIRSAGSAISSGQTTVKEGSEKIGTLVEGVLKKAGYYDGKKKLAQ